LTDFRKTLKYQIFMKIRLVGVELFHTDGRTDGRTDMTKLIVAFRNFANAPKTELVQPFKVYTCQLFLLHVYHCKKDGVTLQNNSTCIYCTNEPTNHLHGAESFFEKLIVRQLIKRFPTFMEPQVPLPCTQEHAMDTNLSQINPVHALPFHFHMTKMLSLTVP
jgi:hypothetical protein